VELVVGQIVACTEAEGPGRRFALWTQGCSIRCEGCCNPHLFTDRGGERVEISALLSRIGATPGIEGISVLGGEPFDQREPLAALCEGVRALGLSVMVFSGFTLEQLHGSAALQHIDILVDGPYLQQLP
jgi:anaerobic ribonucleoside-triphosphate reductase activating protein